MPASTETDPAPLRRLILVTGLSGAGKSAVLHALEDIGYEAVDNLPLRLLDGLIGQDVERQNPLAIGIDIRTRDFGPALFLEMLDGLSGRPGLDVTLLFVDCEDVVLQRRYSQTRRRHPLARDLPVEDGIAAERRALMPLRERADTIFDTTELTEAAFRQILQQEFRIDAFPGMAITLISFSYRHGVPRQADLVFDTRFLRNPHYVDALRPLTGRDGDVGAYVAEDPEFEPFFKRLTGLIRPLLPRFRAEGKSYLTVAVGCTGGRHRSVYTVERLADWFRAEGYDIGLRHRELGIDQPPEGASKSSVAGGQ